VVGRLGSEEEAHIQLLQQPDGRGVGGQGILDHDQLAVEMLAPQVQQQALGGIALAVMLLRAVLFEDGLGGQRDHLLAVGEK
jgi:hypothetical protein